MKTKLLAVIIVLAIAAGGFLIFSEPGEEDLSDPGEDEVYEEEENGEVGDEMSLADTQIKSELSQVQSSAEMYEIEEGSFLQYDSSEEWLNLNEDLPECTGRDSYGINITGEAFVAWAPLCSEEGFYCVDSEGEKEKYEGEPDSGYSCGELFEKEKATGPEDPAPEESDTFIEVDLGQARSEATTYYYDKGGDYSGFENTEDWADIREGAPECTEYQINVAEDNYVIWAELCGSDNFVCMDADGELKKFETTPSSGYSCEEVF